MPFMRKTQKNEKIDMETWYWSALMGPHRPTIAEQYNPSCVNYTDAVKRANNRRERKDNLLKGKPYSSAAPESKPKKSFWVF